MRYRIIKINDRFEVQKKLFGLFWVNLLAYNTRFDTLNEAQEWIEDYISWEKPKIKVIKEYK